MLFRLAVAWIPAAQPLFVVIDDILCRKSGKSICLASMHHDPLLSTARKPFFRFGHVWVVLARWVPLPMGARRGFALPILFRLYRSTKRGGQDAAPSRPARGPRLRRAPAAHTAGERPTKLELARDLLALVAGWAGARPGYAVADSRDAGRALLEGRPANVHVISRRRFDAALWTSAPPRRPGQTGRPRRRGVRLPAPTVLARRCRRWPPTSVTSYGRTIGTEVFTCRALWSTALRDHPVRVVIVRHPSGKRAAEAFFCTDPTVTPAFILEAYARRWTLEVTFHDAKQYLGLEDPQGQTPAAVRRTAPLALIVYALVLLWYADQLHRQRPVCWLPRPWYRTKTAPSFLDMLTALRRAGWQQYLSQPPCAPRRPHNPALPWHERLLATA